MKRLAKYLKPYLLPALLCVGLVFAQAMCDLKLPDYMSDIVNTGVMGYGIEDAVPEYMGPGFYAVVRESLAPEDQALADRYYAPEGDKLAYTVPEGVSRAQGKTDRAQLSGAFSAAFLTLAEATGQLPESMTIVMDDSVAQQVAAIAIRAEYERIGVDLSAIQRTAIMKIGGKMLAVALAILAATVGATLLSARVASGFARDIRQAMFKKVATFSSAEVGRFSTASLITRTTNDVQQVQQVVTMMLRMLIYAPIMGVGGVIYALQKSVSMSWIIALAVVVLLCAMGLLFLFVMPKFKLLQKLVDRLNLVTRENVSGTMVSRAYNTQAFEIERFGKANRDLAKTNLFVQRAMVIMMPFINLIMSVFTLLIIWFGSKQISQATLQIGDMMAYMQYAMHVVMSFMFVGMMFIMLPRAAVSADRIAEVLETSNTIADPETPALPATDAQTRGLIRFDNVSFRYPGAQENALSDISFEARPGQTTAVIGATGSGKTTLMNLILRFFDTTEGQVQVAGQDVRDMTQHDLRGLMGYVPQKSVLFSGTIEENVRFGAQDADGQAVAKAIRVAQAEGFVADKEAGLQEHIAQGGTNVSGGQRQRLSIARALATGAPILLFDDSFSALDFKTDAALRKALREDAAGATLFIVAQRVGTIMHAEQIIVLDEGRIVGQGTHRQLMETCPVYQDIARSQLREEELA